MTDYRGHWGWAPFSGRGPVWRLRPQLPSEEPRLEADSEAAQCPLHNTGQAPQHGQILTQEVLLSISWKSFLGSDRSSRCHKVNVRAAQTFLEYKLYLHLSGSDLQAALSNQNLLWQNSASCLSRHVKSFRIAKTHQYSPVLGSSLTQSLRFGLSPSSPHCTLVKIQSFYINCNDILTPGRLNS